MAKNKTNLDMENRLVVAAKSAMVRSFLTNPGSTSYGAAVFTAKGQIFQGGQYSSFNHVTNVHAEQVALILATMSDDPDVLALAVASNGTETVTRPCGVCRQVMAEHVARIGRDFDVLMIRRDGNGFEKSKVSELLPQLWHPTQKDELPSYPDIRFPNILNKHSFSFEKPTTGDHVVLPDGTIALVWDPNFENDTALVKIKYTPSKGGLRKVSHAFSQPHLYMKELTDLGWNRQAKCGIQTAFVRHSEISGVFKKLNLNSKETKPPGPIIRILNENGIPNERIQISGSRALGIQKENSDWDLVVSVEPGHLPSVREALAKSIEEEKLGIPPYSGTWNLIEKIFIGGRKAALLERRFSETFTSGDISVAIIFVPLQQKELSINDGWLFCKRELFHGKIVSASRAPYKQAEYVLSVDDELVPVTCYHKSANLLKEGDIVSVCGWLLRRGDEKRLVQILPQPDRILWWQKSRL